MREWRGRGVTQKGGGVKRKVTRRWEEGDRGVTPKGEKEGKRGVKREGQLREEVE